MSESSVAVVTGAASGIGLAVARRFAGAGWRVIAFDLDQEKLETELGTLDGVTPVALDVTGEGDVATALAGAAVDSVQACVNVAGIYPPSTFLDFSAADYRRTFDVNVLGTLSVTHACVPYLREQGGSVVNFASTGAFAPGDGGRVLYKAAKAAVVSLTRSMAFELAPEVVVNGLAPGPVVTEGSTAFGDVYAYADSVPLRRLAQPEELAAWVWALAGDDRLTFATGETIVVSGGTLMR